ncbi:MAG TPA: M24 family metallopeptidase, partial [Patescibacteria group bacterium]|nr:M24 family metallopeptidase [Patescibacteria group bacterium]
KKISSAVKQTKHLSLASLRITKTPEEIAKIKKACEIGDKAFSYILEQIKPEMTELQIAALLEIFIKTHGAEISFPSIVAFEENAAIPHHKTGNKKLKINNLILIDFGVKYNNYCSDMTRTIFFGKPKNEQKQAYETVLKAQQNAIQYYTREIKRTKNVTASQLDKVAREHIISQGYPSIPHSLGHGIGLQVHEAPRLSPTSKETLAEGMVFSIEPGIYLPALPVRQAGGRQVSPGFGIRIEDLFAIQNNKLIQLTKSQQKLLEVDTT